MRLMVLVFFLIAPLVTAEAKPEREERVFRSDGLTLLILKNFSGKVKVVGTNDVAKIIITKHQFGERCRLKLKSRGPVLVVGSAQLDWYYRRLCEADFEVQIPRAMSLELENGYGDVEISGVRGDIDLRIGDGNLHATDVRNVKGHVSHGNVVVRELGGSAALQVGVGETKIHYAFVGRTGSLKVQSREGGVQIEVPEGSALRTNLLAPAGRLKRTVVDREGVKFLLDVHAVKGDITLTKYQRFAPPAELDSPARRPRTAWFGLTPLDPVPGVDQHEQRFLQRVY